MNEKRFLKNLRIKTNTGDLTFVMVRTLLEKNDYVLRPSIFTRIIDRIKNDKKDPIQIIEDNFETIINNTNDYYIGDLLEFLFCIEETRHIIIDNLDLILQRYKDGGKYTDSSKKDTGKRCSFINTLLYTKEGQRLIEDNLDKILETTPTESIFRNVQLLKKIGPQTYDTLNAFLEKHGEEVSESLIREKLGYQIHLIDESDIQDYVDTLHIMIKELLNSEGKQFIDINLIGSGRFSVVYQVGSKILKIGVPRTSYEIPNHKRLLQPVTRVNFLDKKNKPFTCVEITEEVENVYLTEDQLYEIYKELREDGVIWTDIRANNVGRLKRKNIPQLNGQDIKVSPNSVGFTTDEKQDVLDLGDIVILDLDFIFSEHDSGKIIWPNSYSKTYEKKWQQEQQEKVAKEHNYLNKGGNHEKTKKQEEYEQ